MHWSLKTFHFLSVSNGLTSILSDISITLWKSHETIFVCILKKPEILACDVFACDVSETSRNRNFFWDIFETSYRRHTKEVFFETDLRRIKDVTKKSSLLRCFWEVSEMSLSMEIWLRSLRDILCHLERHERK